MGFGILLMLTSFVIAGVAGWFSVYGLAHIYQGAFLSVVLMGGALEIGKLVATSYLYRYWAATTWLLKTYLVIAILGLMLITSSGIFGYLSNAYQQDAVGIKDVNARIELIDREYAELSTRESQIDREINAIDPQYVTARMKLMAQYKPEKEKLTIRREVIRAEKLELASKQLEVEAHTGPIIYIAKAMDKDVDTAVMWLSLLIIAVFDPLAVALTIAANSVFIRNRELKAATQPQSTPAERIVEVERIVEEPQEIPPGWELIRLEEKQALKDKADECEELTQTNANLNTAVLAMTDSINKKDRDAAAASEREEDLKATVRQHLSDYETLKTDNESLLQQLQDAANDVKGYGEATTRLEHSLQTQVTKLNKTIERTGLELDVALDGIEERDKKIEALEQLAGDLEDQISELRMLLRRASEMSPTERAMLHQQNVVTSKNS